MGESAFERLCECPVCLGPIAPPAEMMAGRLSNDLARLRDELESQRSDLKRFHDLSVRLSSNLELQRLLNDVLTSIASLQKTDLAMLLLLPDRSSNLLRVATYAG